MDIDIAIQQGAFKEYQFDDDALKQLFLNELKSKFYPNTIYDIYSTKHRINNLGFRGDDFNELSEILIAGCSHTFGVSIDEEHIWATKIKQLSGKTVANIAIPGSSVQAIILNIFAYIKKFGNPKFILCAMPDFSRLYFPQNINVLQSASVFDKQEQDDELIKIRLEHSYFPYRNDYVRPKYSQLPHSTIDVLPLEVPYWLAFQSLNMLEQYCHATNIKLFWGVWDGGSYHSVLKVKSLDTDNKYFNNLVNFETDNWYLPDYKNSIYHDSPLLYNDTCITDSIDTCNKKANCHKEIEEIDPSTFHIGRDRNHWGTHRHQHIAEVFYKELENNNGIS